jgi:DNA-binding PadR family transcriptional regulator
MQYHQHAELRLAQPDFFILACLVTEPKTATAWYEAVMQAIGQGIEPGAFSRMVTRLERRGWIEALRTEHPLRLYQITAPGLLAIERAETQQHKVKLQEGWYPDWRTGTEIIMRLVLWILRLYPPAWRERYEAEMVALLEQHQITFWTVLDLLVGALDARLDPHYRRCIASAGI